MNRTVKTLVGAAAIGVAMAAASAAFAAPIEGNWRTASGETAAIAKCGGSYCVTLRSGKYSGKSIGRMKGSGAKYSGTITDPSDDKKYSGTATVSGNSMKMRGCALKVFCKTQNWSRK
ncbi:DUF2147 domain-containing protein [Ahrensia sp. R2A130]|uniref:DUF2147 domain-containing protein n=1 Tax=Ahrensia sp. R2A130 TaxID=744979 RepID=UPI0001E0F0E3|nr:DUF2147 domain-containing protein [Ahrensia sp. R2A130]EFL89005.1 SN-glycerol-3-phosphate transport ATP-binding protein UgpC [Ahrensia sp. R2A130]